MPMILLHNPRSGGPGGSWFYWSRCPLSSSCSSCWEAGNVSPEIGKKRLGKLPDEYTGTILSDSFSTGAQPGVCSLVRVGSEYFQPLPAVFAAGIMDRSEVISRHSADDDIFGSAAGTGEPDNIPGACSPDFLSNGVLFHKNCPFLS